MCLYRSDKCAVDRRDVALGRTWEERRRVPYEKAPPERGKFPYRTNTPAVPSATDRVGRIFRRRARNAAWRFPLASRRRHRRRLMSDFAEAQPIGPRRLVCGYSQDDSKYVNHFNNDGRTSPQLVPTGSCRPGWPSSGGPAPRGTPRGKIARSAIALRRGLRGGGPIPAGVPKFRRREPRLRAWRGWMVPRSPSASRVHERA
jgi:hypothetical protein